MCREQAPPVGSCAGAQECTKEEGRTDIRLEHKIQINGFKGYACMSKTLCSVMSLRRDENQEKRRTANVRIDATRRAHLLV